MDQHGSNDPSLDNLLRLLRRGLLPALVTALLSAGVMYFYTSDQPTNYRARTTVLAAQPDAEFRTFGVSLVTARPLGANAYRSAATSTPVLTSALDRVGNTQTSGIGSVSRLRSAISIGTDIERESTLIHLSVTEATPEDAVQKANAVAEALLEWDAARAQQNLDRIIASLEEQVTGLDSQLGELNPTAADYEDRRTGLSALRAERQNQLSSVRALRSSAVGLLEILEPATIASPIPPRPMRSAALAFVLALFLVYGVLLLRESLDTRLRDSEDLSNVTGLPVLAEFPKGPRPSRRLPAEAISFLRTNLLFATEDADHKVLLITSAAPGEGKSSVAISLAESFARHDYRTLLVDADMRKPVSADEYKLNVRDVRSLAAHLKEPKKEFEPAHVTIDMLQTLDVIHSYPTISSPVELLSRNFRGCLERWRRQYDVIVIDSAPVLAFADALTIAPLCTGALLVANQQESNRRQVRDAVMSLQRLGVRLLGIAAVNVPATVLKGYGSGYPNREYAGGPKSPTALEPVGNSRLRPGQGS